LSKEGQRVVLQLEDPAKVDQDTKLITAWEFTSAVVHDSQILEEVLQFSEVGGADSYTDFAYHNNAQGKVLFASGHANHIQEKRSRKIE